MSECKRNIGVGDLVKKLLRDGKDNIEILAAVKRKIPQGKTSPGTINWYRCGLRADGENVPTSREIKKARSQEANTI